MPPGGRVRSFACMAAAALPRPRTQPPLARGEAPFKRVLCAVDTAAGAEEAAAQAVELAVPDGTVDLLALLECSPGPGLTPASGSARTRESLVRAFAAVRRAGVAGSSRSELAEHPARALLAAMEGYELAVVTSHGFGRSSGILLGDTTTEVIHRASVPVLVSRALPPPGRRVTDHLLLATDGAPASSGAAELAARIAAAHGSRVTVFVAGPHGSSEGIARQLAELIVATGVEPVVIGEDVPAHSGIADAARRHAATLVIVGSRGLSGVKSLASVSERVAHEASCSVLVAR